VGLLPALRLAWFLSGPLMGGTVSSTLFYRMLGSGSAAGSTVGSSDGRTVTRYADGRGSV